MVSQAKKNAQYKKRVREDTVLRVYQTPIGKAVLPLKEEAVARAETRAKKFVASIREGLRVLDWDANKYAPYPDSRTCLNRLEWQMKLQRYNDVRSLTRWQSAKMGGSRGMGDPEWVHMDSNKIRKFVAHHKSMAGYNYDSFAMKLVQKVGAHVSAEILGSHVWDYSFLTVVTATGETQLWKSQLIVNRSVHGLHFDQWPSRRITGTGLKKAAAQMKELSDIIESVKKNPPIQRS